ncbi:MAG: 50S ribosome-binding protein YggL [Alteromonadaceae bacterium]|mgnify:CR=1 FL=1|jgi:uncharacterized protein YggL (DUF469 family)
MKVNAKNRNRRLRKKLRVDEYQELGFDVAFKLADGTDNDAVDTFLNNFFSEVIQPNALGFGGEGDVLWHGLVCTQNIGKCTDENRTAVESWLNENGATAVAVSELYDVWWAE